MVVSRVCKGRHQGGEPCRQHPLLDGDFCFWHDPDSAQEAANARRLGGMRRRREATVLGDYDFQGLGSTGEIRRLLEVAALDTLSLENSVARARTLVAVSLAAVKLLEVGELEQRVDALERAVKDQS